MVAGAGYDNTVDDSRLRWRHSHSWQHGNRPYEAYICKGTVYSCMSNSTHGSLRTSQNIDPTFVFGGAALGCAGKQDELRLSN